ncbi:hypothetical protein ONP07_23740, partial [Salmonella enterica subsp. enterica serovar Montevideo]|nr:hypothetical protein [Salmonella enterica subsp. enterica serovar Montevideo]
DLLKIPVHHRDHINYLPRLITGISPGIIQRTGKVFQPCFNVSLVDIRHAHLFNTAQSLRVFCGVIKTQSF